MTPTVELDPVVAKLARALGLIDADGRLDTSWFDHPLTAAAGALSDPGQRAALHELLDEALPAIDPDAAERWHPLLDATSRGNVYLIVKDSWIGLAAAVSTPSANVPRARAALRLPLLDASGGSLRVLPGTEAGPLTLTLDVAWASGTTGPTGIAVEAAINATGGGHVRFGVDGLDAARLWLDPAHLAPDAIRVVQALVHDLLQGVEAGGAATNVVDHLPGLLGLVDGLPVLPLNRLASDPSAFVSWLRELAADPERLRAWFGHLAGLLGAGPGDDPLGATLLAFAPGATLALTLAADADVLRLGVRLTLDAIAVTATVLAIPLAGTGPVQPIPDARMVVRVAPLVEHGPEIVVGALTAGAVWSDGRVSPLLVLEDVVLEGVAHDRLDLTNAAGVVDAAVDAALRAALGTSGSGHALLVLWGLEPPLTDPGSPHRIDLPALLRSPTAALADFHRAVLDDPVHPWSHVLGAIGELVGLAGAVEGAGSAADPWRRSIAGEGGVEMQLAAWDARVDPDIPRLRIGFRLVAGQTPWQLTWNATLFGAELPAGRAATVTLVGAQELRAAVAPLPRSTTALGTVEAAEIAVAAAWELATGATWTATARELILRAGGETAGPFTLAFPSAGLDPALADLGLGLTAVEALVALRLLATQALQSWGDPAGLAIAGLAGVHRQLGGLPADWPLLGAPDPARAASLLEAPVAALQRHVERVMTGVSADGTPFAVPALTWLRALLGGTLPACADEVPLSGPPPGSGTPDDPWRLAAAGSELALHLAPDGPPEQWTRIAAGVVRGAGDPRSLLLLAPPPFGSADSAGLKALLAWLGQGDGVVALESQLAADAAWERGAPLAGAHHELPYDPAAIAAIRACLDGWSAKAVILLSAPFADRRVWRELLTAAEPERPAGAHFDVRTGEVATARATYYTADLDVTGPSRAQQLATVADRVRALTGQATVYLVAHSATGLAAVEYARAAPAVVGGVITLATPHGGSSVAPLDAPETLRAAATLAGAAPSSIAGLLAWLRAAGEGWRVDRDGQAVRAAFPRALFAAGGERSTPGVPGLALGALVSAGPLADLAAAAAWRLESAAPRPPTHLVIEGRTALALGDGVDTDVRVPLGAIALNAFAPAAAPPPRVGVRMRIRPAQGWTIDGGHVGALELGVGFERGRVVPRLVLRDVAIAGPPRDLVALTDVLDRVAVPLALPARAAAVLAAFGVLGPDGALVPAAVRELAERPAGYVAAHGPAVLDVLGDAVEVLRDPWRVRFALGAALNLEASPEPSLRADVTVGGLRLRLAPERLTVSGRGLPETALVPAAPQLAEALAGALGPMAVSAALSAALEVALGEGTPTVALVDAFVAPAQWFARPEVLGGADAERMNALVGALGDVLGLAPAPAGLALPGGLRVAAREHDLLLSGTLAEILTLDLGVRISETLSLSPVGTLELALTVPGGWGGVKVAFSVAATEVGLTVQPDQADPIQLLPHFDGFGALADGAARLLPRALQRIVTALAPGGPAIAATLELAKALGIYGADAAGFERPDRSERLLSMLAPGWWSAQANVAGTVTDAVGSLMRPGGPFAPPIGTVTAGGGTVTWSFDPVGAGSFAAVLGWRQERPILQLIAGAVTLGPVTLAELRVGYDGAPVADVTVELSPRGELAFLRAAVAFSAGAAGVEVVAHPLGRRHSDDLHIVLAPRPAVVTGPSVLAAIVEDLGVPLASMLLLRDFGPALERPLWPEGPTARAVLDASGLVKPGSRPPVLATERPEAIPAALRGLRALAAADSSSAATARSSARAEVELDLGAGLTLGLGTRDGRTGVRLAGRRSDPSGFTLLFGDGVTLNLLEDTAGGIRIAPGLALDGFGAELSGAGGAPLIKGSLEIGALGLALYLDLEFLDDAGAPKLTARDPGAMLEVLDGRLDLAAGDGDSFLAQVLPPELGGPFAFSVGWRDGRLQVTGGHTGSGSDVTIVRPLDLDLVIARVTELFLALRASPAQVRLEAAVSADAELGPFAASITRVGVVAEAGAHGVGIGFRAPDGVGLAVDAELVSGGGFLLADEASGQYAGIFELTIAETVSVKVVALISTRLPDGRPGFALLIVITAEGFAPIQLGMGFVLTGIGGLLALNRTVQLETVRGGLKNGVLDSVLFPKDPTRNPGRLLSTLNQVFPQAPDRLLIGPMVTIGWGSPPILTARLALLIELPDPLRLIVLASVSAVLPDASNPIVQLRVDAVGALDLKRGELSLDASIYDSRIWKFALTGDLALRVRWKDDPQFLLSIGGFHPRYNAPPGFPKLERVALTLSEADNPRLRMECYLALTSNSIQFGARVEIYAAAAGFELRGDGGFDALIQWSPFHFEVDVYARLAVRFSGSTIMAINLELGLTGPDPWRAHGVAEIQFLFLKARVSFELTIGEDHDPPALQEIDAGAELERVLFDSASWSAELPASERPGVTFRDPGQAGVLAHPLSTITVRQRVLPLEVAVSRIGAYVPRGGTRVYRVDLQGGDGLVTTAVTDRFALGQFQTRTDDQRLTDQDFIPCTAGYTLSAGHERVLPADRVLDSTLVFETLVLGDDDAPPTAGAPSGGLPERIGVS